MILVLGLCAGAALAQEDDAVPVRTGTHAAFTRIVFQFPVRRDWRLGRSGDGYELALPGGAALDLSGVFDRIDRDRIASMSAPPDGTSVQIDLACTCHATAFRFNDSWLVIDINDGAPPDTARFEAPVPPRATAGTETPAPDRAPFAAGHLTDPGPAPVIRPLPDMPTTVAPGDELARAARVADAQAAILEEISRAAGQGLLQGTEGGAWSQTGPGRLPVLAGRGAPGTAPLPEELAARIGIAADTAVDTAAERDQGPRSGVPFAASCPAPAMFDVPGWSDGSPPGAQIGALRRQLVGEFDRPDRGAALALARLYINLGFGAEAAEVTGQFLADDPAAPVLHTLADIVDTGTAPPDNPLRVHLDCPGPVALWAALARHNLAPGAPVRRSDLAQAFAALPGHLRRHLGPMLAERLLAHDDAELAGVIRRSSDRAPGDPQPGEGLAAARLDLARGAEGAGRAALEAAARAEGPQAAEALAELMEKLNDEGEAVPPDLVSLAAARAFELRRDPMGTRLKAAALRAQAIAGDAAGAFDGLARAREEGNAPDGAAVWLTEALAGDAPDAVLAATYFRHRKVIDGANLPAATARALALRLGAAGLAPTGLALLDLRGLDDAPADHLARAELHLADDDPAAALLELDQIAGERTEALRARALAMTGAPEAALAALESPGNAALRADLAWRAGDWDTLRQIGDADQRAALDAAAPAAVPAGDAPATLAGSRALLAQSADARARLQALIDAYPAPDPDGGAAADPAPGN